MSECLHKLKLLLRLTLHDQIVLILHNHCQFLVFKLLDGLGDSLGEAHLTIRAGIIERVGNAADVVILIRGRGVVLIPEVVREV